MKNILLAFVAAILLLASCGKDDAPRIVESHDSIADTISDTIIPPSSVLQSVVATHSYEPYALAEEVCHGGYGNYVFGDDETTLAAINTAINGFLALHLPAIDTIYAGRKILVGYKRDWHICSKVITYSSTSASGEPITLSARVSYPKGDDDSVPLLNSLSLYLHYYYSSNEAAPSVAPSPIIFRTLYNSLVVEPDLEGYGTAAGRNYCGFSFDAQGRQVYDCFTAVFELLEQEDIRLQPDYYTTLWGYSLATPALVAFARLYDEQLSASQRRQLNIKSLFAGSSIMQIDQELRMLDADLSLNAEAMSYAFPFMAALPQSAFGDYALSDFAPEWMHTYTITRDGQEYIYYDALLRFMGVHYHRPAEYPDSVLRNHFASDMCLPDGHLDHSNSKVQTLLQLFHQLSDWGSWMPSVPIYLTHCQTDAFMPFEQTQTFYDSKKISGRVYFKAVQPGLVSRIMSDHASTTFNATLLTLLHEDPATAYNNFR